MLFFDWWQRLNAREFKVDRDMHIEIKELNTMREILLPPSTLTWCGHWDEHLPEIRENTGPFEKVNMYSFERAGATMTKVHTLTHFIFKSFFCTLSRDLTHDQVSHSVRALEKSIMRMYTMRDLCSYLRVHNPATYFPQAEADEEAMRDGYIALAGSNDERFDPWVPMRITPSVVGAGFMRVQRTLSFSLCGCRERARA